MWDLDHKESWAPKNWCFWTVVLEKTLESSLDCKEIQPVLPKGNQSWISIGRTDVEVETPILWPPDAKNWLTEKDPDAGKDWRQEEKGMTEDEMLEWRHQLNGHKFEQTPGAYSNSCPSSRWCRPAFSSSVVPLFSWLQLVDFTTPKILWPIYSYSKSSVQFSHSVVSDS